MIKKEVTPQEYFDDPVNTTLINERCIEIPHGIRYIDEVGIDNLVEVGCVMPFYGYCEHLIVDQFEKHHPAGTVVNADVLTQDLTGRDVLCLSTIEHCGKADYDNPDVDPQKAIDILKKFHEEAKSYLITWGIGYHLELDEYVKDNLNIYKWFGFVKTDSTKWDFVNQDMKLFDGKFDDPYRYSNANIFLYKGIDYV